MKKLFSAENAGTTGDFDKSGEVLQKRSSLGTQKRKDKTFYWLMLIFPLVQFTVFYICVNANSLLLAFRQYNINTGYYFVGLDNFKDVFYQLTHQYELIQSAKNSLIVYGVSLVMGVPCSLLFSYYIYKKMPLSGVFKIILFMPSIISGIAMAIIFNYFVEKVIPELVNIIFQKEIAGLFANPNTTFITLLFYSIWSGFGSGIVLYSGAMSAISDSVVEAGQLEGASPIQEFFYITLPLIFPTITTFLVVGVAGIFTNQLSLFSFFGSSADYKLYTFGYYMYTKTQSGSNATYPFLSCLGLVMTFVAVPLTLGLKYLLEKYGPRVD